MTSHTHTHVWQMCALVCVALLLIPTAHAMRARPSSSSSSSASSTTNTTNNTNNTVLGSVYYDDGTFRLEMGVEDPFAAACGHFEDNQLEDGWGVLHLLTNATYLDSVAMYAAGYLEGALTQVHIYQHSINFIPLFCPNGSIPENVTSFLQQQDQWLRTQVNATLNENDPYWIQMGHVVAQHDGLMAGYADVAPTNESLTVPQFWVMQDGGDMFDISNALNPPDWKSMGVKQRRRKIAADGHCSALFKVTAGFEEVFMGHTSWFAYGATTRIFKYYNFPLNAPSTVSPLVAFSSYPATLGSFDDFYMTSYGLTVIETSLSIFNNSIYSVLTPESVLYAYRVILANRMSSSAPDWVENFSRYNSGTYNNQWMVFDSNKFIPSVGLEDDAFWVAEQIPGLIESGDMTPTLRMGYWPSYNVPSFANVYKLAGYPTVVASDPAMLNYETCCRANIFRRDQASVHDMTSYKYLMRYNDYENDPFSLGQPELSISSRFDLDTQYPMPMGGYDTKTTSYTMSRALMADVISGPTQQQPVFEWTPFFETFGSAIGLPQQYDFDFVAMAPDVPSGGGDDDDGTRPW
eukprot:TRINITY_DN2354_c2_g1_i1.p1 TRINITY_DN2354_c2_g1~~TRINITY_DN2354_c2_g1_i1.p1  ORF type:complete len:603 (-),score=165.15 TRINITY_DN2354_c2_g1_i1:6-1736(-)